MAFAMHIHTGHRPAATDPEVFIVVGGRTTALLVEAAVLAGKLVFTERRRHHRETNQVRVIRTTGWEDAVEVAGRCAQCALVTDASMGEPPVTVMDGNGRLAGVLTIEEALSEGTTARTRLDRRRSVHPERLLWRWLPHKYAEARLSTERAE